MTPPSGIMPVVSDSRGGGRSVHNTGSIFMIQLAVMRGDRLVQIHHAESGSLTLGRGEWNDIILDDPSVSRDHARLLWEGDKARIVDLGSRNQIQVQGRAVKEAQLGGEGGFSLGVYTIYMTLGAPSRKDPVPAKVESLAAGPDTDDAFRILESLFILASHFPTAVATEDLLETMLDKLLEIFSAERGLILLTTESGRGLVPRVSRHLDPRAADWAISQTIAQKVATSAEAVLTTDALAELEYAGIESIQKEQIRSIVCLPLQASTQDVAAPPLGVLYLDSRTAERIFSNRDVQLLHTFARHAAQAMINAKERSRLQKDVDALTLVQREVYKQEHNFTNIVARNRRMVELLQEIADVAQEDVTTLILGESGTGKELIAKAIHYSSPRKSRPFVAVNCMALAPDVIESELFGHEKGAFTGAEQRRIGRFELADGGTLFLDEIGDLAPSVQLKLLRVLQEGEFQRVGSNSTVSVDVRIVAATNADLKESIKSGRFREDLYYRLNVFSLTLPPLRQRMEDIPPLVDFYVDHFNKKMGKRIQGMEPDALKALQSYSWPGNIREFKNVMERAFALSKGERIQVRTLPHDLLEAQGEGFSSEELAIDNYPPDFHLARDLFEKNFLLKYLVFNRGNIAATAQQIGIPRKTIYRKLEEYNIPRDSLTDPASS